MILEAVKKMTHHPGVAYAKAAVKKRVKFKDLPKTHQKAIMAYMAEGDAWGDLDPSKPKDVRQAIKLYGNKPFLMGELTIDDELKQAVMSSNDFSHDSFDEWVRWYSKNDPDDVKAGYNQAWPVILNQPSAVPNWGLFEDGWHRFNYYYLARNKKKVPFIQYIPGVEYMNESRLQEAAFFSKRDPVNTGGRIVPRKLSGIVYHGSSVEEPTDWFDTLNADDYEAAAVWVTPEEAIAKDFGDNRGNRLVFVNKYKLKSMKTAELDLKAYNRLVDRGIIDGDEDMRQELADYLSGKGYDAWLTTGSIMRDTYEDIAIFPGSESEAEYVGTSFRLEDGSWTPYEYFYDVDEVVEFIKKHEKKDAPSGTSGVTSGVT